MERRDRGKAGEWAFLKGMIHGADIIIEVVDARDVQGTRLPAVERMAGSRRLLMVANKTDLLPGGAMLPKLANKGFTISATTANENQRQALIRAIMARTKTRPVRALLVGYPNVGKSTLINMLAHRSVARVSPVAGTTKDIQWINITPDLTISDYRGLFPKKEAKAELVRKGAMDVRGDEEVHAHPFAERVLRSRVLRSWLERRFDVDLKAAHTSEGILAAIAARRRLFIKGGELNLEEAARLLVRAMKEAPEI
ncbi:MAG: 50S ribosome-binding GTPase [Candidatus ainarchaeum sp.]|nr:50S ribosome-binding GTPase [Candidatus ainarchaeum sp.]